LNSTTSTCVITKSLATLNSLDWEQVIAKKNIYLSIPYLESLVSSIANDIDFVYVIFYNSHNKPIVAGLFQLMPFRYKKTTISSNFCKHFGQDKNSDRNFSMNILVCGNMFATGENGFLWTEEIGKTEAFELMVEALKQVK
jgi:hypothetical protein